MKKTRRTDDDELLKALASPRTERATFGDRRTVAGETMRAIAATIREQERRSPGSTRHVVWTTRTVNGELIGWPIRREAPRRGLSVAEASARTARRRL